MKKVLLISTITASLLMAGNIKFSEANPTPKRVAPTQSNVTLSYYNSIKEAKKSVVNISTTKTLKQNNELEEMFNHPLFKDFFGDAFRMPKRKQKSSSLGSGVIISKDGYIVTNNHVVEGADEILVTLLDTKNEYKAKIIGLDPDSDLAVIKIEENDLHNIPFANSKNLLEGDVVFAIGNPFGVGGSVTQGIISALNKSGIGLNNYENFIQTDASINPGNSGGALVDSRGALVGINSAILSRSGGNNGIGFAIPSNMVKNIAKSLIETGHIDRGFMGVTIGALDKNMKEIYTNKNGALVTNVSKDKPAYKAGLKRGDLIIKVDDKDIEGPSELKNMIGSYKPNSKIDVTYERDNKIETTTVKLDALKSSKESKNLVKSSSNFLKGLNLTNINDNVRKQYHLSKDTKGVLVLSVDPDSKSEKFGFRKGDIIVQVEQKIIKNIYDLNSAFEDTKRKKVRVWVNRNGYVAPILVK